MFWIVLFGLYTFAVSVLSGRKIAVVYALQFLAYVIVGAIMLTRYVRLYAPTGFGKTTRILLGVGIIYAVGMLVTLKTGPIYPHQTGWTARPWGGFTIRQAVGFSEGQNLAGVVVTFFISACLYLYHGRRLIKICMLSLFVLALLGTISRGAILSTILGFSAMWCIDNCRPLLRRGSLRISSIRDAGFVVLVFIIIVAACLLIAFCISPAFVKSLLPAFGLTDKGAMFSKHLGYRFKNWKWGIDFWLSNSPLKMLFGGGFRSSMILTSIGSWYTAHNVYITILGEFGVVGLTIFISSILLGVVHFSRLILTENATGVDRFALLALLIASIHNITGTYFYSPVCLSLLLFIFAIAEIDRDTHSTVMIRRGICEEPVSPAHRERTMIGDTEP